MNIITTELNRQCQNFFPVCQTAKYISANTYFLVYSIIIHDYNVLAYLVVDQFLLL